MGALADGRLEIRMFGRFEVARDGEHIPPQAWGRQKTRTLLKILLVERGRVVPTDRLIEWLYPDSDPDKVARNLRGRVSTLRRALEPELGRGQDSQFIQSVKGGYAFSDAAPCWLDTEAFQTHLESAEAAEAAADWGEALRCYETALDLYRDDLLVEDVYDEWSQAPRERWRERFLDTLARAADCAARLGDYDRAIAHCQAILEVEPHREAAYRRLMEWHHYNGEPGRSLEAYGACETALRRHLGVEPTLETRELYQAIRREKLPRPRPRVPTNLPRLKAPLVGRLQALSDLTDAILTEAHEGPITLVGPGGVGKTRLALEVGERVREHFADGVFFVPLVALRDARQSTEAIGRAVGFSFRGVDDPEAELHAYLHDRRMLLILDNAEHLLPEISQQVLRLLEQAPAVQALVTSRERLHLKTERPHAVAGLTVPDVSADSRIEESEAGALFLQTARRMAPDYQLSYWEWPAVVRLCRLLEGLPLGIELAASWVATHRCDEIVVQIEDHLDLSRSPHGADETEIADERHDSLHAALAWSWQLLTSGERRALARLSVFRGDFSRAAAAEVAGASPAVLASLVDKSWLQRPSAGRFALHETMRGFADAQLRTLEDGSASERVVRRHARHYLLRLPTDEPDIVDGTSEGLDAVEREVDNVRAAWAWAARREPALVDCALDALSAFYEIRSRFHAGEAEMAAALDTIGDWQVPAYRRILVECGRFRLLLGRYDAAQSDLQEGLRLARAVRDPRQAARALLALGRVARERGDYAGAERRCHEARTLYERLSCVRGQAHAWSELGTIGYWRGTYADADRCHVEALRRFERLGDRRGIAHTYDQRGLLAHKRGENERARRLITQGLDVVRELGDRWREAAALNHLGIAAYHQGRYDDAERSFEESLEISRELGQRPMTAKLLNNLGNLVRKRGRLDRAERYLIEAIEMHKALGQSWDEANTHVNLGTVALEGGDLSAAQDYLCHALEQSREIGSLQLLPFVLVRLAQLFWAQGDPERAADVLSTVRCQPDLSDWARERSSQLLGELSETLSAVTWEHVKDLGSPQSLDDLAAAILDETACPS